MCVRVCFSPDTLPAFDAEDRVIIIPSDLNPVNRVILVRAILRELVVPQPALGAVCWCGESIDMTPRVPHQKRSEQVMTHG